MLSAGNRLLCRRHGKAGRRRQCRPSSLRRYDWRRWRCYTSATISAHVPPDACVRRRSRLLSRPLTHSRTRACSTGQAQATAEDARAEARHAVAFAPLPAASRPIVGAVAYSSVYAVALQSAENAALTAKVRPAAMPPSAPCAAAMPPSAPCAAAMPPVPPMLQ